MWQEVGPAVQVNKVFAVFKRRRVVGRHAPGTLAHVVAVGLVVRAVRVLAAVDVLAGDSQEETREDKQGPQHGVRCSAEQRLGYRTICTLDFFIASFIHILSIFVILRPI